MNVIPAGDRLLIRRDDAEGKSKGGILIPEKAQPKPRLGTVLAVGLGRRPTEAEVLLLGDRILNGRMPVAYCVGQRVLFNVYGQHEIPGEEGLILVREEDVLAVVEG